jgi:beta-phosphoglucomutase
MKPYAVIFDFDGVVVDSISTHLLAWRLAAKELFQIEINPVDMEPLMGRATRSIADFLCTKFAIPDRAAELVKAKSAKVTELRAEIPLRPGVFAYMNALQQNNIPFGIASNAPREFVRAIASHHKLPIKVTLGVEDADRPKPAPDLFLKCAQMLKVPVTEHRHVLVFEDSTHGLEAAVKAGMKAIGVTSMHSESVLREAGAKEVTLDFSEFMI